jgi:hypothetical protein
MCKHHQQAGRDSKVKDSGQVRREYWGQKELEPDDTNEERDEELPIDKALIPAKGGNGSDK